MPYLTKKNTLSVILFYFTCYFSQFHFTWTAFFSLSSWCVLWNNMLCQFTYCINGVCCYLLYVFDILMEFSYRRRSLPANESHTHFFFYQIVFVCEALPCATSSSSTVPYSSILFFAGQGIAYGFYSQQYFFTYCRFADLINWLFG